MTMKLPIAEIYRLADELSPDNEADPQRAEELIRELAWADVMDFWLAVYDYNPRLRVRLLESGAMKRRRSEVVLAPGWDAVELEGEVLVASASLARGRKCVRCYQTCESVGLDREHRHLCARCVSIIRELQRRGWIDDDCKRTLRWPAPRGHAIP